MARKRFQRGSVEKRNGKWVFRYREDTVNGMGQIVRLNKRVPFADLSTYPTKRLALRDPFVLQKQAELASFDYRPKYSITFGELTEKWKANVLPNHKPSTRKATESYLKHLSALTSLSMSDLSTMTLQGFVHQWSGKGLSPKTIRNLIGVMKSIWTTGRGWGFVSGESPFDGLILPKRVKPRVRFFTIDEMRKIVAEAPERYRTFFWLAAETGMRAGELAGLRWEDVNCDRGIVQVRQSIWGGKEQSPKTPNAIRHFAISPELRDRLSACKQDSGLVFTTSEGTPVDPNMIVKRKLYPILDRLGIERAGMHAFRHGNITEMDRQGVPLGTRIARSGHSELDTNLIYTQTVSEDDAKFARAIGLSLRPDVSTNEKGSEVGSL